MFDRVIRVTGIVLFSLMAILGWCTVVTSCESESPSRETQVVVYTSLDRPHSKPVIDLFEQKTGIRVRALYDTEASKTVGLVNRLVAEAPSPKADVFWNSEVIRTIVLQEKGVLSPYKSPSAAEIPASLRDPEGYWTGFGARARVFLVNTELTAEAPQSYDELTDAKWQKRFAIANPLFGTTGTDIAHRWTSWGEERTKGFLAGLRKNGAMVASGNATACEMVANGRLPACLSDTDDALVVIAQGRPVRMIFPDQGEGQEGALLIPNTVSLIRNGPNSENGRKFIDFLLSPEVEELLARLPGGQIPVRKGLKGPEAIKDLGTVRFSQPDFKRASSVLDESAKEVQRLLLD